MPIEEYIYTEFRRYYPNAADVLVHVEGESIHVRVMGPDDGNGVSYIENYSFNAGSDDDWYVFEAEDSILTIPLMPEVI